MAIIKLQKRLQDRLDLRTHVPRSFSSSSNGGYTGSVSLISDGSPYVKNYNPEVPLPFDINGFAGGNTIGNLYGFANEKFRDALQNSLTRDYQAAMSRVLETVNSQNSYARGYRQMGVQRFTSPFIYDVNYNAAKLIKDTLPHRARVTYSGVDYSFKNYHCLNFFTSSEVPESSALIYPLSKSNPGTDLYTPARAFTFDFYINPRYTNLRSNAEFKAGTILHVSSTYALSLVSGSDKDVYGRPSGFRLLLQLSSSADTKPSLVDLDSLPAMTFVSQDNALKHNNWHHVAIRWGTNTVDAGVGSFIIDGTNRGDFTIDRPVFPSGSYAGEPPTALFMGNYFEGIGPVDLFFNSTNASKNGVVELDSSTSSPSAILQHPLRAEIHDVKIYNSFRSVDQIYTSSLGRYTELEDDLLFYVPPFFVRESPKRTVPVSPFDQKTGYETKYPVEVSSSLGLRMHNLSLENYLREFVQGTYPLPHHLSASIVAASGQSEELDRAFMSDPGNRKRAYTVLPCDNGFFVPNFELLNSGTVSLYTGSAHPMALFVDDFGQLDKSNVTLRNYVDVDEQKRIYNRITIDDDLEIGVRQNFVFPKELADAIVNIPQVVKINEVDVDYRNSSPPSRFPINNIGSPYQIADGRFSFRDNIGSDGLIDDLFGFYLPNRIGEIRPLLNSVSFLSQPFFLRDYDCLNISGFSISNLLYGDEIREGSFILSDNNLSGSGDAVQISLRDKDGQLYRADSETPNADWNRVGLIYYGDGLAAPLSPSLPFIGKETFSVELSGTRDINILELNVPCYAGQFDSSSNPTFKIMSASDNFNDKNSSFVYLTGLNFHDENLNIVAKANFSQPIIKRQNDRIFFRVKFDF